MCDVEGIQLYRTHAFGLPKTDTPGIYTPSSTSNYKAVKIVITCVLVAIVWFLLLNQKSPFSNLDVFKSHVSIKAIIAICISLVIILISIRV
jgi:hypothetical protein